MARFQDWLREQVSEDIYSNLVKEAQKEVSLSLEMPLINEYRDEQYYEPRLLVTELRSECEAFEELEINISPLDVVTILFRSRLLFAVDNEKEYQQRGGTQSYFSDRSLSIQWIERSNEFDDIVDAHLKDLNESVEERTLIVKISQYNSGSSDLRVFFDSLFQKLGMPFVCFFDDDQLISDFIKCTPSRGEHTLEDAKKYFLSPSIGFRATGSEGYVEWYAFSWLRTFLNLLRLAGFTCSPQIDFGMKVELLPPTYPVFLGTFSQGAYCWYEDKKRPWEKVPDGCLFLSFGYRGLSNMWLDDRSFEKYENFILENRVILDQLENPWLLRNINDIFPTMEILSSTTQTPDLGAKILQIYCCLEHLFVPKNVKRDNVKYIHGAINALRSDLLPWFDRLYDVRCDYAHEGYVTNDGKTLGLVFESVRNALSLLTSKLMQP